MRFARLIPLLCTLLLGATALTVRADVRLELDLASLNRVLGAIAVHEVHVPLTAERSLRAELRDLRVVGFDLSAGPANGRLLTRVRVVAPEVGLDVPVEPRIRLDVVKVNDVAVLEMRFEAVSVPVPLMGRIDLARFVPPLQYPTENLFSLQGAEGEVEILARLLRVEMGREVLRFIFDVGVAPLR